MCAVKKLGAQVAAALDGKAPTKQQLGQLYNAVVAQAEGMTVEELMTEAIKAREQEQAAQEQASQEDSAQEDTTQEEAASDKTKPNETAQDETVSPENLQTAEYKAPDVDYTAPAVKTPTVELKTPSEIAEQAKNAVDGNVPRVIDARNRYEPQKPTMSEAELEALRERIDQSTSGKGPRYIDARNRYEPQQATMSESERAALSDRIWRSINHELPRYYDARNQGGSDGEANMAKSGNAGTIDGASGKRYNRKGAEEIQREALFEEATPKASESTNTQETASSKKPYTILFEASVGAKKSRSSHRYHANKNFYARMANDPAFKKQMDDLLGYDVMVYMKTGKGALKNPSPELEWHHPVDNRTIMELMYKKDHRDPKLQKYLHFMPNHAGGYATNF